MSLLSIRDLHASYGDSQALFGVDLQMREGEVTALMGRNGMGKSTTVKALCRLIRSQGTLTLFGQDLSYFHVWVKGLGSEQLHCPAVSNRC